MQRLGLTRFAPRTGQGLDAWQAERYLDAIYGDDRFPMGS